MATWKRFTGAVDSSTQSFLKNKRFSREKKKFTWDWHAWNLALVSTPSVLLAYYLHGVEKQMQDEAAIREEIQETTGVSSRGFLIPKRDVREDVLGMLSAGNQRGRTPSGDDGEDGQDGEDGLERNLPADLESIQGRLAAIESMLLARGDSKLERAGGGPGKDSSPRSTSASHQGRKATSAGTTPRAEDNPPPEAAHGPSNIDKAIATASVAGSWAVRAGERQGQRLVQMGREWLLARENRQEGSAPPAESGLSEGDTAEHRPVGVAVAGVRRQGEEPTLGKTSDRSGTSVASKPGEDTAVESDGAGSVEGAWRRGSLDGNERKR